jgi:hypothetical protein
MTLGLYILKKRNSFYYKHLSKSQDSTVGIATGYGLDDQGVGVQVPVGAKKILFHVIHTGSGAHPAPYPMGTGGSFPRGKAAGV